MLSAGLLCLTGSIFAEPVADQAASDAQDGSGEVWGDPEFNEEADTGWTWFGMGYERRMRGRGMDPGDNHGESGAAGSGSGEGGK